MNTKTKSNSGVSGGALYTFDLKNTIGGLPAQIALTNTNDSDCPQLSEKNLGFSNYTKLSGGRSNAHKKQSQHKSQHKSHKKQSQHKSHKKQLQHKSHKTQSQNKYSRKSQNKYSRKSQNKYSRKSQKSSKNKNKNN